MSYLNNPLTKLSILMAGFPQSPEDVPGMEVRKTLESEPAHPVEYAEPVYNRHTRRKQSALLRRSPK